MSFSAGTGKGPSSEINVTPLIDIVLVLLIVFMVMTPVMLKELVAAVPRKATDSESVPPGAAPLVFHIGAEGREERVLAGIRVDVSQKLIAEAQSVAGRVGGNVWVD